MRWLFIALTVEAADHWGYRVSCGPKKEKCALLFLSAQRIRHTFPSRHTFFDDVRALTRNMFFSSWDHLLDFMMQGLEFDMYRDTSRKGNLPIATAFMVETNNFISLKWCQWGQTRLIALD